MSGTELEKAGQLAFAEEEDEAPLESVVHCFFNCGHVVRGAPIAASEGMERHYQAVHDDDITRALGGIGYAHRKAA